MARFIGINLHAVKREIGDILCGAAHNNDVRVERRIIFRCINLYLRTEDDEARLKETIDNEQSEENNHERASHRVSSVSPKPSSDEEPAEAPITSRALAPEPGPTTPFSSRISMSRAAR